MKRAYPLRLLHTPFAAAFVGAATLLALSGCQKEITVDLPDTPEQLVVEGTIEPGSPPIVILTRTQSYFAPTDVATLASIFVHDANVTVTDNTTGTITTLTTVCSDDLTEEQLQQAAAATGLDPALLAEADICIFSSFSSDSYGAEGHSYSLHIEAEGKTVTAVSFIPHRVPLDSVWFKLAHARPDDDSLGYAWGHLTDPDTTGNAYRWSARRISHRSNGDVEDPTFISPLGTTFNDKYINGLSFDFNAVRGRQFYSDNEEDNNEEAGYFKVGDTIAVRFFSMGQKEYDFYTSYDNNVGSTGDLFSTPANVKTNINGGLGVWCGRAVFNDTIICTP